jgi:hypothetical protein
MVKHSFPDSAALVDWVVVDAHISHLAGNDCFIDATEVFWVNSAFFEGNLYSACKLAKWGQGSL